MTERGLPIVDGAPACPFVAFEDDRDERATSPDHRHRCYAEASPAPRALAHQEAYCLASAFPVCPTFQDWARREAARARTGATAAVPPPSDEPPRRNPQRGWSAPPPWAGGSPGTPEAAAGLAASAIPDASGSASDSAVGDAGDVSAPEFLAGRARPERGLAGSAADRLAGPSAEHPGAAPREGASAGPKDGSRVTAGPGDGVADRSPADDNADDDWAEDEWAEEPPRREPVQRERAAAGLALGRDRRPRVGDTRRQREPERDAPSWERPRRSEAYPTLKTRVGRALPSLAGIPRAGLLFLALVVAAIALFFLPALLGIGGPDRNTGGIGASPSAPAGGLATPTAQPTPTAAPTPVLYVVQPGDTLSGIASRFGVSLAELIDANRERLPDPDRLNIGDELIIPAVAPDGLSGGSPDPSLVVP